MSNDERAVEPPDQPIAPALDGIDFRSMVGKQHAQYD
jgi:hypothetical protein